MSRILVFGSTGQVAQELSCFGNVKCLSRVDADLKDPHRCAEAIKHHAPVAVINAAAYTAVDEAESDEEIAEVINAYSPKAMAEACKEMDIPLVHISTDYVFNGSGIEAFTPNDQTSPLNSYGRTKLFGEHLIKNSGCIFLILRTSWVFSAHGNNFVKTMLRLGGEKDHLSVVSDQVGGPTSARTIAQACVNIAEQLNEAPDKSGIYHLSGAPYISWAEFATNIFKLASMRVRVTGIPTAEYPTPAVRPLNSRLDCSDIERVFGIGQPDWRAELKSVLNELGVAP